MRKMIDIDEKSIKKLKKMAEKSKRTLTKEVEFLIINALDEKQ